jgi:hypothetical protein
LYSASPSRSKAPNTSGTRVRATIWLMARSRAAPSGLRGAPKLVG